MRAVEAVEESLQAVSTALRASDTAALEQATAQLRRCLLAAMHPLRQGALDDAVRQRLARAVADLGAQREIVARAAASADRALGVLLPSAPGSYSAEGGAARTASTGATLA